MKNPITPYRSLTLALIAMVGAGINVYIAKTFAVFGSPLLFAGSLLVEVILLLLAVYGLLRALVGPGRVLESIARSSGRGAATDPYIQRLWNSQSRGVRWLGRRLKPSRASGLPLTITLVIATIFFYNFTGVLFDVLFHRPLTTIDTRVANLIPSIRTPAQTSFFSFVTFLAGTEGVIILLLLTVGLLLRKNQKVLAGVFVISAAIEEAVTFSAKHLVGRPRPDRSLSLVTENSPSFPSGHTMAATILFGFLAYILYKSSKSVLARLAVIISFIIAVFLVGLSRIYLGVHYPSDVIASVLLGGSILTLVIGALEIAERFKLRPSRSINLVNRDFWIIPVALIVTGVVLSPVFVRISPAIITPARITLPAINETTAKQLPLYSETLSGRRMEPIGFVYVGYASQIETLFASHGWHRADASTVGNTLKAVAVGFQGGQYLTAPVTPSYLGAKPEDIAFEKPTASNSLRQRHHTRLWRTDYTLPDGTPLWVATASLDEGVELAGPAKLPTHHINPNLDAERAFILSSLGVSAPLIQVVDPQLGKNAGGDGFFTDGRAAIIRLTAVKP